MNITDTERLDRVLLFLNKASVYGLIGKKFTRRGIDAAIRATRRAGKEGKKP